MTEILTFRIMMRKKIRNKYTRIESIHGKFDDAQTYFVFIALKCYCSSEHIPCYTNNRDKKLIFSHLNVKIFFILEFSHELLLHHLKWFFPLRISK